MSEREGARRVLLYHCAGCGRELRRDYCRRCGTFDNTATNEIVPPAPPVSRIRGEKA